MKHEDVLALLNEPACTHNSKSKSGCARPQPGSTQVGCCFDGARGCTSFNKLFFMRHFREPIALQTTAMDQMTTVPGADGNVVEALATICGKNRPSVIGLITTGLSEAQRADIPPAIAALAPNQVERFGKQACLV